MIIKLPLTADGMWEEVVERNSKAMEEMAREAMEKRKIQADMQLIAWRKSQTSDKYREIRKQKNKTASKSKAKNRS